MKVKDLEELLQNTEDKLSVFENKQNLNECKELSIKNLLDFISDFLTDEEKVKLLSFEHFKNLSNYIRQSIIIKISDDEIKVKVLLNDGLLEGINENQIGDILNSLGEYGKNKIIQNSDFIKKHEIREYQIDKIILSLSDENKINILYNRNLLEKQLGLKEYNINKIIESLNGEESKLKMIAFYDIKGFQMVDILKTFNDESKKNILFDNKYDFQKHDIQTFISSMSVDYLVQFLNENKEFLYKNDIKPYQVIKNIESKKQTEIISKIEEINLTMRRKKRNISNFKKRNKN